MLARITLATRNEDGTVTIRLRPVDGPRSEKADMVVVNAPATTTFEEAVVGIQVEGDRAGVLLVAGVKWAERVGRNRLRLVKKKPA
jgi:hypothetical protein